MKRKRDSLEKATTSACGDDGDLQSGAEFEVFLNFRGPDTRLNFTDCLYHSLVGAGIRVFRDNEEIRKGEKIGGELLRAIESSKIYVPIFSKNYASSAWCLRELTHMVECSSKVSDKLILPIFYDVNPDDVKLKTRLYLDDLEKHEKKVMRDEVLGWKEALTEVATVKGWGMKDKGHGEIINTIVDEILTKLMKRRSNLPDHLVGIDDHVKAIMDMLNEGSHDVRYLVIHGMGGIGKTTLASAVFNKISNQFQGCSFLSDIRESMQHGRMVELQKQLLSEILQGRSLDIHNSVDVGIKIIRERFHDKKVLLVLDDVDKWDQLSKLAGKRNWFGPGSKIIITTRDINFLPIKEEDKESSFQAHSQEFKIYEMIEMDPFHALRLFSKHAFRMDWPPHDYDDISHEIIRKTGGLPLALEVIGSSLYCKSKIFWKDTLKKLDFVPKQEVFNKLKISYDMLEHHQREIFLDIACFFIGRGRINPYYMWKASKYFPKSELFVLTQMSLIKIDENDILRMHDQLRDFGREIVQREDNNFPGKRSRLWEPKIAFDMFRMKEVSKNLKVIEINSCPSLKRTLDFSKCLNLKRLAISLCSNLLVVDDSLSKLEHLKHLRIICWNTLKWDGCNLFPLSFVFDSLKSLSKLEINGTQLRKLHHSIGEMTHMEYLSLDNCSLLRTLPDSIGDLTLLRRMSLYKTPIKKLPNSIGGLESLLELYLSDTKIRKIPTSIESLKKLRKISLSKTPIEKLPNSIGGLESLLELYINDTKIRELPTSIGNLKKLRKMSIYRTPLKSLPNQIGGLESLLELYIDDTKIRELPASIGNLKKLRKMSICWTPLKKLPNQIGGLESLLELNLRETCITNLPVSIKNLKWLEILCLDYSAIRKLPNAAWRLENLKALHASFCENLKGEIPREIGGLSFFMTLELSGSKITRLPTTMNKLSNLQRLHLDRCDELEQLPKLPVNLKELKFSSHLLWTTLDLSYLGNLVGLHIRGSTPRLSEYGQRAPNIEWIERLSHLERLTLVARDATFPLINLATVFRLQILEMTCVDPRSVVGLPPSLRGLTLHDVKSPMGRSLFLNLTNLSSLCLSNCQVREVNLDDLLGQQPEKLHRLDLKDSAMLERLLISRLRGLQELSVTGCPGLMETQGLEKSKSLKKLSIHGCSSLEWLPDSSKFKKRQRLYCPHCPPEQMPDLDIAESCPLVIGGRRIAYSFSSFYKVQLCHKHLRDDSSLMSEP
ncbi:disease resistance protein RPV1 [Eucalyptus grandis]|uniref:disease resistance protein RPV1 n=1 Tax=Eucalyptus grandis TaxID=71139 RepID=UPI00192E7C55|nr:disease resistance protein RPV1 [Eucalyptus grandis]